MGESDLRKYSASYTNSSKLHSILEENLAKKINDLI